MSTGLVGVVCAGVQVVGTIVDDISGRSKSLKIIFKEKIR